MQFSLAWLRELCPTDDPGKSPAGDGGRGTGDATVSRIAEVLTSRGLTTDSIEALGDDHVLDLDIPANRPDCLGHRGVARELAAALGCVTAAPTAMPDGEGGETADSFRAEIQAPEACGRFTGRIVRGVQVGPSPRSVVARLEACGLRSINNVVDASNLVMLEVGNPIHFFDLHKITDGCIQVRRARDGETLTTLDGIVRSLTPDTLLIADPRRPLAVAGIMGGADSEIDDDSSDVLIEAAYFAPGSIRATARRLGLQTDASHRFERGVDPEGVVAAQALAARLLRELADGRPDRGLVDSYPGRRDPRSLTLRLGQLERLLGYRPGPDEAMRALAAVGLEPRPATGDRLEIRVPTWRVDLEREADLVEEVARHLGYDRIPVVVTELIAEGPAQTSPTLEERARDALAEGGFHESSGYAMLAAGEDEPFMEAGAPAPLRLANPISETMDALRRSILPGLVKSADLNLRRGVKDVRLFEVERVFLAGEGVTDPGFPASGTSQGRPTEPSRAGLAWSGAAVRPHWSQPPREVDLFDMAGAVERVLERLRPGLHTQRARSQRDAFHPRRSMCWKLPTATEVAWCGQLHPRLAADLPQPLYLGVIDLDALQQMATSPPHYRAVPRLGSVSRDLAVVMTERTTYAEVLQTLHSVDPPARVRIDAVDRYEGPPLPDGEASLTIRLTLQPEDRSLTEDQIEGYRSELIGALKRQLGLTIRS